MESQNANSKQALNNSDDALQAATRNLELLTSKAEEQTEEISSLNDRLVGRERERERLILETNTLRTEIEVKDKIFRKLGLIAEGHGS